MKKSPRLVSALCAGVLAMSVAAVPTFAASQVSVIPTRALDNAGNMYVTVVQDGQNYTGQIVNGVLSYTNGKGQQVQQQLTTNTINALADTLNNNTQAVAGAANKVGTANNEALGTAAGRVQGNLANAGDSVADGLNTANTDATNAINNVSYTASKEAGKAMANAQERASNTAAALGQATSDRATSIGQNVNSVVDTAGKAINNTVQNGVSNGVNVAKSGVDAAAQLTKNMVKTGIDTAIQTGQAALSGAAEGASSAASNTIVGLPQSLLNGITSSL